MAVLDLLMSFMSTSKERMTEMLFCRRDIAYCWQYVCVLKRDGVCVCVCVVCVCVCVCVVCVCIYMCVCVCVVCVCVCVCIYVCVCV